MSSLGGSQTRVLLFLWVVGTTNAWLPWLDTNRLSFHRHPLGGRGQRTIQATTTQLYSNSNNRSNGGGLLKSLSNFFLQNRQGDFEKLEQSGDAFGPGPLMVLYNVPAGIDTDEIQDMIADGAPKAYQQGCKLQRINGLQPTPQDDKLLDSSLQQALELINAQPQESLGTTTTNADVPVLLFSGFQNQEMMTVYNILGKEIYDETAGQSTPACAKAVPNAMSKPLRQVLDEIAGDHKDAMASE